MDHFGKGKKGQEIWLKNLYFEAILDFRTKPEVLFRKEENGNSYP